MPPPTRKAEEEQFQEAMQTAVELDGKSMRAQMFCERLAVHSNETRAAIEAGYSKKSAAQVAAKLLKRKDIQATLQILRDEAKMQNGIELDYIIQNLKAEAEDFGPDSTAANRIKATVELAKLLGFYTERVEHSGSISIEPTLDDLIIAHKKLLEFKNITPALPPPPIFIESEPQKHECLSPPLINDQL